VDRQNCYRLIEEKRKECETYGSITVRNENLKDVSFLNLVLSMTVGSVVLLIAAFTLFAGGVLLLIRKNGGRVF